MIIIHIPIKVIKKKFIIYNFIDDDVDDNNNNNKGHHFNQRPFNNFMQTQNMSFLYQTSKC